MITTRTHQQEHSFYSFIYHDFNFTPWEVMTEHSTTQVLHDIDLTPLS